MKIAVAQINAKVGDIDGNTAAILSRLRRAEEAGADLALFPEAALTGYPALDLWEDRSFIAANLDALHRLAAQVGETACLVGFIGRNISGRGKPLHNCAALLYRGKVAAVRAKSLLPTYDVFDEARYFQPARDNTPLRFKGVNLGITICEDIWHEPIEGRRKLYAKDPVEGLLSRGAELILNLSASPFFADKPLARYQALSRMARSHGVPFFYCNLAGGNDEIVFDGNSMIFGPRGELWGRGKPFEEDFLLADTDRPPKPLSWRRETPISQTHDALVCGIRDFLGKCGFSKAVLGLSGGIDSAVVCALAAKALGPKNVIAVMLPSKYTSKASKEDAAKLARNLGVRLETIGIDKPVAALSAQLTPMFRGLPPDTTEQNLQSRVRGTLLMALANKFRALLLSTGNKSEVAMGYCTLYGDMCGGLNVLGDVSKDAVYALARHINAGGTVIPVRSITRPPSAELKPNQKDQDDLPPYPVLDRVIRAYVEEDRTAGEIKCADRKTVLSILGRIDRNEFKRRQAAPCLKTTPRAFGAGRKMPVARGYHR